jgi:polyisoprenoid-binding protein YceI
MRRSPLKIAMRIALLSTLPFLAMPAASYAQTAPTFAVVPGQSSFKFFVKASMSVSGTFDRWNTSLKFASDETSSGVLDIKIQSDSVNTGSGLKDRKIKGDDFFAADKYPQITFHSTKIVKTGANTYEVDGDFTIRGVTKPEKLTLTVYGAGTGSGTIRGTMGFNRKDYGINGEIPLVRIADQVGVTLDINVRRTSGPPLKSTT